MDEQPGVALYIESPYLDLPQSMTNGVLSWRKACVLFEACSYLSVLYDQRLPRASVSVYLYNRLCIHSTQRCVMNLGLSKCGVGSSITDRPAHTVAFIFIPLV